MEPLFFTFLDGAFRYDCPSCGQACCRGKGVALDARRELVPLLARAPAIAPFLEQLPGGYVRLPDVTDGCWFLQKDGLCGYETEHGRDAKFVTCRLFPFNRVFRAGGVRVVDFNSVICPLQDAFGSGAGVTHAELRRELEELGDGPLTASAAEPPAGAEGWRAIEESVVAESERFVRAPDYPAFAARQLALAGENGAAETVALLLDGWRAFYGVAAGELATFTAPAGRALALLTPSLRFNALFRRGGPPYRAAARALPRQLLATWFLSTLAARASRAPLSLRGTTELHQAQLGLRELLSRFSDKAALLTAVSAPDAAPPLQAALAATCAALSVWSGPAAPFGERICAALQGLPPPARPIVLSLLARAGSELKFES